MSDKKELIKISKDAVCIVIMYWGRALISILFAFYSFTFFFCDVDITQIIKRVT